MKNKLLPILFLLLLFSCQEEIEDTVIVDEQHTVEYGITMEELIGKSALQHTVSAYDEYMDQSFLFANNAEPITEEDIVSQLDLSTATRMTNEAGDTIGYAIGVYVLNETVKRELYLFEEEIGIDPYVLTKEKSTGELLMATTIGTSSVITEIDPGQGGGGGGVPDGGNNGIPSPPMGCTNYRIIYYACAGTVDCGSGYGNSAGAHSFAWGNAEDCPIAQGLCSGGTPPTVQYICFSSGGSTGGGGGGIYGNPPGDAGNPPPSFECMPELGCADYDDLDVDGEPDGYEMCVSQNLGNCYIHCADFDCDEYGSEEDAVMYQITSRVDLLASELNWLQDQPLSVKQKLVELLNDYPNSTGAEEAVGLYVECGEDGGENCCNIIGNCPDDFDYDAPSTIRIRGGNKLPCLDDIVDDIIANSGNIADILEAFDSDFDGFKFDAHVRVVDNFNFLDEKYHNAFGATVPRGGRNNRMNVLIYLNKETLGNASQIPIAKTFIHEILHGYIVFMVQRELCIQNNDCNRFDDYVDITFALEDYTLINLLLGEDAVELQHEIIAENWVPVLTTELENLDLLQSGIDISNFTHFDRFMEHYAWAGLDETSSYIDSLTNEQKFDSEFLTGNELNLTNQTINIDDYGNECD